MPFPGKWVETINIADIWKNDDLSLAEQRDQIVARIKASHWYRERDADGFDERGEAVDNLSSAADTKEFDGWWSELYDFFDYDRVWIDRF